MSLFDLLRSRLLPALVTAAGVVLITAGLLSWVDPATAGTAALETPVVETLPPSTPTPTGSDARPSGDPGASPSDPLPSLSPGTGTEVATRVLVPALNIDLPVIAGPSGYPPCNVAMYLVAPSLGQPGEGRATYLYAHARRGMFLPFLDASKVNNGRKLLGMTVQVYTSGNLRYLYEITEVRRHQRTLDDAMAAEDEELWLQTSEGPNSSYPKLQVVARPVGAPVVADPADANPTPKPAAC